MPPFGNNIKILRKRNNLTQRQLEIETGVPLSTIKRYERGQVKRPSADSVDSLAKCFHYTNRQLLEHDFSTGDPEPADFLSEEESNLRFFEGETYKLYYISEKDSSVMKNGKVSFDKSYDKDEGILCGKMDLHHKYYCKLKAVGKTVVIYGAGKKVRQQIIIVLHCPDFGEDKSFKYRGGIGFLIHIDTHGILSAQRICLLSSKMNNNELNIIYKALMAESTGRLTVQVLEDSIFSQWILKEHSESGQRVPMR